VRPEKADEVMSSSSRRSVLVGGIEIGGTKLVAMIATAPDDVTAETRIATTTPDETLDRAVAFLAAHHAHTPLAALGIAPRSRRRVADLRVHHRHAEAFSGSCQAIFF
jgi:predicted NBD/HSP70 family sugar kinase